MRIGLSPEKLVTIAVMLGFGAVLAVTGTVKAQQPTPSDNQVNSVAHELYCPVCENIPLDVCPTQACAQWRDLIRQKLALGWSKQRIEDYFAAQYGDRVLAVPPLQRSFNQLLPAFIAGGILIGVGLVVWVLRNGLRAHAQPAGSGSMPSNALPGVDDEYLRRIEEDLRHRT